VKLNIGGSLYDPDDPVGRLLFNVLAMIAEFESDLIRMRTREGKKVARAKGRLRGKQPKLKPAQEAHLVELWRAGQHASAELAGLFSVTRSTVYGAVSRVGGPAPAPPRSSATKSSAPALTKIILSANRCSDVPRPRSPARLAGCVPGQSSQVNQWSGGSQVTGSPPPGPDARPLYVRGQPESAGLTGT
jgi:hypothetical protein